ncbi:MAG: HAMP domain-containing sensor histidine kinase [Clostridiaceae bacterium]
MAYICIAFFIISFLLAARLYFIRRAINSARRQMEEIEEHPERNRQLKAFTANREIERLIVKINDIYQARQQERIIYQRRETQIRREIENISHDLRTPLTSIIGYVDLIQDKQTQEVERENYLNIIKKRARILQGFIRDFYELSRIEADDYPFVLDIINVQNILSEVAVAYYNEFNKKKINVEIDMDEKPCYIIADKIQFNRILNNLIQNALKYSHSQFAIKQYILDGKCIIQFRNDKGEMKEDELKYIFDRFYTGDSSRNSKSTGLGLTISKLLVERMKGNIEARLEGDFFIIELCWKVQ